MSLWQKFLSFVYALLRVRCDKPRLPAGTASMAPQVVRDRFENLYCEKFKHHAGPCTAKRFVIDPESNDGAQEETVTWEQ